MVGVIVISESKASQEMLKTVMKVLGKQNLPGIVPVVFDTTISFETRQEKLEALVVKLCSGDGVLIFTELYGASQTNVCKKFFKKNQVEVICGYNLPMLIEAASLNETAKLKDLCDLVIDIGKKYIRCPCCG